MGGRAISLVTLAFGSYSTLPRVGRRIRQFLSFRLLRPNRWLRPKSGQDARNQPVFLGQSSRREISGWRGNIAFRYFYPQVRAARSL